MSAPTGVNRPKVQNTNNLYPPPLVSSCCNSCVRRRAAHARAHRLHTWPPAHAILAVLERTGQVRARPAGQACSRPAVQGCGVLVTHLPEFFPRQRDHGRKGACGESVGKDQRSARCAHSAPCPRRAGGARRLGVPHRRRSQAAERLEGTAGPWCPRYPSMKSSKAAVATAVNRLKSLRTRGLCARACAFRKAQGGGCAASARRCVYATRALLAALCCTHSARAPHALRTAFRCVGHPAARAQPGSDIECPSPQPRHTDSTTSGSCTQIPGQRYTRKRHVVHAQRGGGGQWAAAAAARM